MPDLLLAFAIVVVLVALDFAAHRYGVDSRFDFRDQRDNWW